MVKHKQEMLIETRQSLKKNILSLDTTNVTKANPNCSPCLSPLAEGWIAWAIKRHKSLQPSSEKKKKIDALGMVLGGTGIGMGILSSKSEEVLANKLHSTGNKLGKLNIALNSSPTVLGKSNLFTISLSPQWEKNQ